MMIREFAKSIKPRPTPAPSAERISLADLIKVRAQVQQSLIKFKQQLRGLENKCAIRALQQCIRTQETVLEKLNADIQQLIDSSQELKALNCKLQQIVGIGPVVSAILLATMPELGHVNRRQIAKCMEGK